MAGRRAELLSRLRRGIGADDAAGEILYEAWLSREAWRLTGEALPLLVGVDPAHWAAHLQRHALSEPAAKLSTLLGADLGCGPDDAVAPSRVGAWAERHGCGLPAPFERLLGFIRRAVPQADPGAAHAARSHARAAEREQLLGAALALVARFPERCRDEHGFVDGLRVAELILDKAVLWFPLEPPTLGREEIAALLERYLS